ncbi:MAG: YraN family protein [Parvularcula sp.]
MARPDRISRKTAERLGRLAEDYAALMLMLRGYRILDRRYRTRKGEVDLVAKKGKTLCFIEVKARPSLDTARRAMSPQSEQRIAAAATLWIGKHRRLSGLARRYDLVAVAGLRLQHVKDAFRPDANQRSVNLGDLF